jgi:hypothetical protein
MEAKVKTLASSLVREKLVLCPEAEGGANESSAWYEQGDQRRFFKIGELPDQMRGQAK